MVKEGISLHISAEVESKDFTGKRYVITRGTSGAGEATVKFLAEHGADVITCGRSTAPAQGRIDALPDNVKAHITLTYCNLADLDSVEAFATQVTQRWDRIDGLVNNGGAIISDPKKSTMQIGGQKYETMFMVNHVAHFHLTTLLMPLLERNDGARVINLSSVGHDVIFGGDVKYGHIFVEDVHCRERKWNSMSMYGQSKLATHMHGYLDLDSHFNQHFMGQSPLGHEWTTTEQFEVGYEAVSIAEKCSDKKVYAFPVHPGTVEGGLGRDFGGCMQCLLSLVVRCCADSLRQVPAIDGAQTTLHCLLSDEALQHNGVYHAQTGIKHRNGLRGGWPFPSPNPESHDKEVQRKLWELTEKTIAEVKAAKANP